MKTTGRLYHAHSNTFIYCELSLSDECVVFSNDEGLHERLPKPRLVLGMAIKGQAQDITLPDGRRFLCDDKTFRLNQHSTSSFIERSEQHKGLVIGAIFFCPLLLYWLFFIAIPHVAASSAGHLPQSVIETIGQQSMTLIEKAALEPTQLDEQKVANAERIWLELINQLQLNEQKYRLGFYQSEFFGANAFALPHGQIVVTDDLILKLADYDDAFRAVLLHEIGHVEHRHSVKIAAQTAGTTVALAIVFGDLQGIVDLALGVGTAIMQQQFSQGMERQADDYALSNLLKLGYKPEHFATALEIISQGTDDDSQSWSKYLSTHPHVKSRIEKARTYKHP
ncbi:M48 family metallopeptidase [Pseudoalteromonas sp. JBTF-M23]|uniref:M48 family metallopeptidase n=1 Tax=Pseudoalteromonas caenipelagi TaxID=2726988 RepID=A0A849VBS1_9GAMM|nr:M48 family metallopeptidase [Pseudoalteromonas caenipelagi]NOU50023.1 M48 family metallopeptidase [Pseudoalteromonas caenipelagi]